MVESFSKEIEDTKQKQKNKQKPSLDRLNNRLKVTKERFSKLEDTVIESKLNNKEKKKS